MKIVVAKFGGTSMADADAMLQSAKIAINNHSVITVVSATSGTTDVLIELASSAQADSEGYADHVVDELEQRHISIAKELDADESVIIRVKELIEEIRTLAHGISLLHEASLKTFDSLQGMGEQLSSTLMVAAFKKLGVEVELLDAREIIHTDENYGSAVPDIPTIRGNSEELKNSVRSGKKYVTQGFIAQSPNGSTTTLGRGGSDYSAALFAESIGADELQIWTDVSGVASTDPRICPEASHISEMSFQEAAEMATSGAKILYAPSVMPARRADIPVFVGNTFAPEEGGTWIRHKVDSEPTVRGITLKKNQSLIRLRTPVMVHQYGFLAKAFDIFGRHRISIDQVTTSEVAIAVTLDSNALINNGLMKELEEIASIDVEEGLSLVSIIGNTINHTPGLAREIFASLQQTEKYEIAVRMICQGASRHNFCFLVAAEHGEESVKRLHKTFIEEGVSL